ncbi:hypothetical protein DFR76_111133 [Nocardia pseudobrasiliensis]|uniref:Uncharacterized protein n=1 Tax=Nocardia pseudobrasiliensis TaxID=45979 RepID=A0A370HXC6_9NOCA|nr:hypothetical protein DFR76_111133 [Nocardia pseudobrasiliensis]
MYAPGSSVIHDHDYGKESDYESVRWRKETLDRDFSRFSNKWKSAYLSEFSDNTFKI